MAKRTNGGPPTTKVCYVGRERFLTLTDVVIDIGSKSRRQITPSQLLQYMIDIYGDRVREELTKDFSKWNEWEASQREKLEQGNC